MPDNSIIHHLLKILLTVNFEVFFSLSFGFFHIQLEVKPILVEISEKEVLLAINCVWISLFFSCIKIKKKNYDVFYSVFFFVTPRSAWALLFFCICSNLSLYKIPRISRQKMGFINKHECTVKLKVIS